MMIETVPQQKQIDFVPPVGKREISMVGLFSSIRVFDNADGTVEVYYQISPFHPWSSFSLPQNEAVVSNINAQVVKKYWPQLN